MAKRAKKKPSKPALKPWEMPLEGEDQIRAMGCAVARLRGETWASCAKAAGVAVNTLKRWRGATWWPRVYQLALEQESGWRAQMRAEAIATINAGLSHPDEEEMTPAERRSLARWVVQTVGLDDGAMPGQGLAGYDWSEVDDVELVAIARGHLRK